MSNSLQQHYTDGKDRKVEDDSQNAPSAVPTPTLKTADGRQRNTQEE